MADRTQRGGIISVQVDGVLLEPKGDWTYNTGEPMREAIIGTSGVPGYKTSPQVAFCEGAITDRGDLDTAELKNGAGKTVVLGLANGKSIVYRSAWFAGAGDTSTAEGELAVRYESGEAEEVAAA